MQGPGTSPASSWGKSSLLAADAAAAAAIILLNVEDGLLHMFLQRLCLHGVSRPFLAAAAIFLILRI
jgi:hypothetical protein